MTTKIRTLVSLLLATGLMAFGAAAHADSFTIELSTEFSGATEPEGSTPWLSFTVDDQGTAGSVNFTITAVNLSDNEYIKNFYFNFDPNQDANLLTGFITNSAGINYTGPGDATCNDCWSADGAGYFDFLLEFQTSAGAGRFTNGEVFAFTLNTPATITAADFNFMNVGPGGNCCWTAASHIGSIGPNDNDSGWIGGNGGGGGNGVPEPGTLALFGLGLTAIGFATRRRRTAPKA